MRGSREGRPPISLYIPRLTLKFVVKTDWTYAVLPRYVPLSLPSLMTQMYQLPGLRCISTIWVLVAQWLERLTGDQKVAGSIPVWGWETFFWVCDKIWVANSFPLIYQAASHPSYIYIYIYTLIRYTDISRLLFSSTCVALTNRYISWPSLCHLTPGANCIKV